VRTDELAAAEARARLAHEAPPALEPDRAVAPLLKPAERLLALRRGAHLDRRQLPRGSGCGVPCDLYLTTARLILLGQIVLSYDLPELSEVALSGERLLVLTCDGRSVSLDVEQPRLLRVEVAAARSAAAT